MKDNLLVDYFKCKIPQSIFIIAAAFLGIPWMLRECVFIPASEIYLKWLVQTIYCCLVIILMPGILFHSTRICIGILLDFLANKKKTRIIQVRSLLPGNTLDDFRGKISEYSEFSEHDIDVPILSIWFFFCCFPFITYICDQRIYSKDLKVGKKYKVTYYKFSRIVTSIELI